jgi:anion-transporting  ArsA/GET3 family ATPase
VTRILICCGAGGVGKTTLSAALGVRLARQGRRVAVLTIDPARRLADSLGLEVLGDEPCDIHLEATGGAGEGRLDALVLDVKATFDRLVHRFSPTREAAARILGNRYYHFAATRLAGTHEYMALERLHELVESELYDAVVLDTPPTRHALEFLTAPDRLARFLDHRVLRVLALPRTAQGLDLLQEHSGRALRILDRLVGSATLREIAEFVAFLEDLTDAVSERIVEVRESLCGARFYLVTTPVPAAQVEALAFLQELLARELPFHGYLVNRCTPRPAHLAPPPLPQQGLAPPEGLDPATWDRILSALARAPARFDALAAADLAALDQLRRAAGPDARLWTIPSLPEEAGDLAALDGLGPYLPGWED